VQEIINLDRLKPLAHQLRAGAGDCPFVVDQEAAQHVTLSHYSGGRDATYVSVSRKHDGNSSPHDALVTIGYAPFVEGTTIIYDVTDEMIQGKARPFVCDLTRKNVRVYAMMPFQVETISLRVEESRGGRQITAAFLDARGETIEAALPFELRLIDASGKTLPAEFCATDRRGQFAVTPEAVLTTDSRVTKVVVRSLLTGYEESLTF
jgi:hypothetical protein